MEVRLGKQFYVTRYYNIRRYIINFTYLFFIRRYDFYITENGK